MMGRGFIPVLLGASLGLGWPHAASAQKLGDVINGLAGHSVVPMRGPDGDRDGGRDASRDAYERGRADAYREQQPRYEDDRPRRDDDWRRREDDRRRADADADARRRYGDDPRRGEDRRREDDGGGRSPYR